MLIDRKVERYVHEVISHIPAARRTRAARDVSGMVYDMIGDYAGGREPDILDARAVLKVLGDPKEIALTWLASDEDEKREGRFAAGGLKLPFSFSLSEGRVRKIVSVMMNICTFLAVCLVALGLLALSTHAINTMLPIFAGCVLGLVVVTGRGVLVRQYWQY